MSTDFEEFLECDPSAPHVFVPRFVAMGSTQLLVEECRRCGEKLDNANHIASPLPCFCLKVRGTNDEITAPTALAACPAHGTGARVLHAPITDHAFRGVVSCNVCGAHESRHEMPTDKDDALLALHDADSYNNAVDAIDKLRNEIRTGMRCGRCGRDDAHESSDTDKGGAHKWAPGDDRPNGELEINFAHPFLRRDESALCVLCARVETDDYHTPPLQNDDGSDATVKDIDTAIALESKAFALRAVSGAQEVLDASLVAYTGNLKTGNQNHAASTLETELRLVREILAVAEVCDRLGDKADVRRTS